MDDAEEPALHALLPSAMPPSPRGSGEHVEAGDPLAGSSSPGLQGGLGPSQGVPEASILPMTALPLPASNTIAYGNSPALNSLVRIFGVVLVDFDHALGPKIEFSTPARLKEDEELGRTLPFLALPDGAHARDEDYSYFHVLAPNISPSTIFGISCNRQLASSLLVKRSSEVTRSTVQKAIVVLASQPIFGPIRDKLGVITRAFFAQKDFTETEILDDFYRSLEQVILEKGRSSESAMYMGTSIRELILKFRFKTLMLLKLLMLQRKIMFYGAQVERLCTFQYSLVSLMPTLLTNLDDAASPVLDDRAKFAVRSQELRTSDRASLLKYLGLPLNVFGAGSFFQPYLPLQQIDMLSTSDAYLVGTTNSIFQQQRDCQIDVLVNIDTGTLEFLDPKLAALVHMTAADRKWMDELVSTVSESLNTSDPARPVGMKFIGSDDFLRAKFEEYICSALAAIKFADFLTKGRNASVLITNDDMSNHLSAYNESWIAAFKTTEAFALWDRTTDAVIFDLVEPRHPCEGQTHLVQDVGIRLAQGVHDLKLDTNLAPTKEALRGLAATGSNLAQTGGESVWKAVSALRTDLAKRQTEYRERKEREKMASPVSNGARSPDTTQQLASSVQAGYTVASAHAANFANSVGSFFSSSNRPRTQPANTFVPKPLNLSPDPSTVTRSPKPPPAMNKPVPSPPTDSAGTFSGGLAGIWRKTSFGSGGAQTPPLGERKQFSLPSSRSTTPLEEESALADSRRNSRLSEVDL